MPLLILLLVVVLVVLPIWMIVRIVSLGSSNDALQRRLDHLEQKLIDLREKPHAPSPAREAIPLKAPPLVPSETLGPAVVPAAPLAGSPPAVAPSLGASLATAKLGPVAPGVPPPKPIAVEPPLVVAATPLPPPIPSEPPIMRPAVAETKPFPESQPAPPPLRRVEPRLQINWEQFMGAKMFAWLGGLAALLGVAFGVKYSFEHDLIPPEVRVAGGFLFALGLVISGLKIRNPKYAVLAQTLCATGVVSLYTVTFACNSVYHFAFFGAVPTFLLMTLITAVAFLLAVRMDARVVAVLGILGGFLTPVLLSTGQDNPAGLFGYLALLDAGLVTVALHRRWHFLVPLGAGGTVLMQIGWAGKFFADEKSGVAMIVCLGFSALFLGACLAARRWQRSAPLLTWSAVLIACVCFGFASFFLGYPVAGAHVDRLFCFVLAADACLFALAWIEGLSALVALAAAGTVVIQIGWGANILTAERAPAAMLVCLGFCALFFVTYLAARRFGRGSREITASAVALPFVAFGFAFAFLNYHAIAARPGMLFTFVLAADAVLLALAWIDEKLPRLHLVAGLVVFALLAAWTNDGLTAALLPWALAFYLLHAVLHTAFPLVLQRHRPAAAPTWWSQLFPPLALLLMLGPLVKLTTVSLLLWPCILLVDLLAIGLALVTASLTAVGVVLVLTLAATGVWIFRIPATTAGVPSLLGVIGGFAVVFFLAGIFLSRRLGDQFAAGRKILPGVFGDARAQIPAFSALLPFLLLIMMTQQLPLANPSPVFGLALLLVVLVLGLAYVLTLEWLPVCALAGVVALEYAWRARHLVPGDATLPLCWFIGFYAIFTVYPFFFRRRFESLTGPWAVAALSGIAHFHLVYRLPGWPQDFLGLIPAVFAVAPLLSLVLILRGKATTERARLNQLAWFGGVALFFITLIFPIQFSREWITIGWALEGAALLWLFHRVPHGGLRATGVVLLVTAFARLALNPAALEYHARSSTALFNWYLYSYGVVTVCLFLGAMFLAPPRERVFGVNTPPLLNALGTVLAFLLVNIEIADFFSTPGSRVLTFQFSGNFARDMSYTIAWALFALALLLVSIWKKTRIGRYAAIALLTVALAKLFFHDIAHLDALYKIGALFAVAVIATAASFAYQRFLPGHDETTPPKS